MQIEKSINNVKNKILFNNIKDQCKRVETGTNFQKIDNPNRRRENGQTATKINTEISKGHIKKS